ncbi:MAG: sigma 54-interacting transcriptional regulator [Chthoniobacteraceae bacterium]
MPKKSANPAPSDDAALWAILEQTSAETGQKYLQGLVQTLARLLHTDGAWVTEFLEEERRLKALAFWMDGRWVEAYETNIAGTPCEAVIQKSELVHFPERLLELFPHARDAQALGLVSYLGVPLKSTDGRILGHLAVVDRRPMPNEPRARALFQVFAERATAELRRMQAEAAVREREEKLSRVVNGAMDAIIELDAELAVTLLNPAAETVLGCESRRAVGLDFSDFLSKDSAERLAALADELQREGRPSAWIGGGLEATRVGGEKFTAEATLSCFRAGGQTFFALVLRNVNDRLEAERRIHSLEVEAEYLREELRELQGAEILGQSKALRRVLEEVQQVAATDATVLIQGETGTGKELFARAIHGGSRRRAEPMITVNCAAIPAQLIESEFFGHEKGAFTGATSKREGRFALADRGTIFLDEIGELPLELQAKLLRVLQEGTFEPVGSGRTQKVDVRVVAATNRDLRREANEGKFREDLFYRLNVFPIQLPPLRERPEDIPMLAEAFARRFAQRLGKPVVPLTADCAERLRAYAWPGNVRELENVVERAVITAVAGRMNFARALPEVVPPTAAESEPETASDRILSATEMEEMERRNYVRALEACSWRVSGDNGAARMLGLNASTMTSRMKALGIKRP